MALDVSDTDSVAVVVAVERTLSAEHPERRYPVGANAELMIGVNRIPEHLCDEVVHRVFDLG